jgi:hypothetical protein
MKAVGQPGGRFDDSQQVALQFSRWISTAGPVLLQGRLARSAAILNRGHRRDLGRGSALRKNRGHCWLNWKIKHDEAPQLGPPHRLT